MYQSVNDIRLIVLDRVDASGLRTVAKALGMSHGTLHNFLNGTQPGRGVPRAVLKWLGLQRVMMYVSVESEELM